MTTPDLDRLAREAREVWYNANGPTTLDDWLAVARWSQGLVVRELEAMECRCSPDRDGIGVVIFDDGKPRISKPCQRCRRIAEMRGEGG